MTIGDVFFEALRMDWIVAMSLSAEFDERSLANETPLLRATSTRAVGNKLGGVLDRGADAAIVDLGNHVSPATKPQARRIVSGWLQSLPPAGRQALRSGLEPWPAKSCSKI